ncbi:unnamed protein product, partial [Soboliphyme baturini]|uniref:DUF4704 domain-containing protein n=1 Tax=Soboliphyme baturini TaxID=241478 RepID=A0A183IPM6_9BILA
MTPRDLRLSWMNVSPPFIEFDMSIEGFGCLLLPSLAPLGSPISYGSPSPQLAHAGSVESTSFSAAAGGLGNGERLFPPLTGLTFMCWLYVERFSSSTSDAHPLRLFCVTRSVLSELSCIQKSLDNLSFTELALLQIQLSPADRALLIGTYETDTPGADLDRDTGSPDAFVRVSVDELKREKQWTHLTFVFNRSVLKSSSPVAHLAINATVGTPPGPFRKQSTLRWRLGTTYLIEEGLPAYMVAEAYALGPHYTGSFQSPFLASSQTQQSLIPEEKISFGLHATAHSTMTLSRLRKVYNRVDSRAVAKMLGISNHENITPVRILHNSAAHLNGPARTLGAVVIGYLGMRTFCPKPVSKLLESVGGVACLIELVALADDTEALYASVKALFCAILAMILKKKSHFLNSHVLYLLFSLVGTLDATRETVTIPSVQAFEDMFCDVLVWSQISVDLQRMLYEHFYQLITDSSSQTENLNIIRQVGLLSRVLQVLVYDRRLLWVTKDVVFNLIAAILQPIADDLSLLRFGHFVVSTLCLKGMDNETCLPMDVRDIQVELFKQEFNADDVRQMTMYNVYVRNRCLNILLNMLLHTSGKLNMQLCENVARVLGFDWLFAFLSPGCHDGTVWTALQILLSLTKHPSLMQKFQDGTGNGHWLSEAEVVVENRAAVLLGFSVSARGGTVGSSCDLNPEICNIPGYVALQLLLPNHASLSGCFLALLSMLVGQPAKNCLPCVHEFDLDTIWSFIFAVSSSQSVTDVISKSVLSLPATGPLLAMVRRCISENNDTPWCQNYPTALLQFFTYFYHNVQEFSCYAQSEDFAVPLALTLFSDPDSTTSQTQKKNEDQPPHPAVKLVIDLLRNIIIDSFSCGVLSKGDSVIDLMINLTPDSCDDAEYQNFITSLFSSVVVHVVASDVLVNGSMSSMTSSSIARTSYGSLAANVFYFTSRLVDCVWNGMRGPYGSFLHNGNDVFDYILKLINQLKRRTGPGVPYDSLYSSLNRFVLFVLSRSCDNVQGKSSRSLLSTSSAHVFSRFYVLTALFSVQTSIRECLCKIIANRGVIFSPSNNDPEFFACLIHLLFLLAEAKHAAFMVAAEDVDNTTNSSNEKVRKQYVTNAAIIVSLSTKVWEETFLTKKQLVEEIFNSPLCPEICASRALASESASRIWQNFVSNEVRGCSGKDAQQIHSQLQSTLTVWMKVHISLIQELVELQYSQYQQWHEHTEKWCLDEWFTVEQELMRERGLWGPMHASVLDKYMLDSTEGPCRKRKKLVMNPTFYSNYPYRPNQEQKISKCKLASSRHSGPYYEKMKLRRGRFLDPRIIDLKLVYDEVLVGGYFVSRYGPLQDRASPEVFSTKGPDNQTLLRLLEEGEELNSMFRCARVNGLDTTEGLLLFGRDHYYVIDGFTLLKTREIRDLDFLPEELHCPIVPYIANGMTRTRGRKKLCSKFAYEDIRECQKRRYLLQPIAIEVFSADGRNYLLAFPKKMRNSVYSKFLSSAKRLADSANQSVSGQKSGVDVEHGAGFFSALMGESSVTQRWVRGDISNFQYLMYLNTLAGRSYNDLSQYPVFPWVLADYESEELDYTSPETFRDFSKPMGAQSPERLEQFMKRYLEWDDPTGETPPYMYGTHYSSAMIVLSYLVRLEPFTQQFLKLQGGHFDLADRMFHSIKDAWVSASRNNMADVKELIPEFFYLPYFLTNSNEFDLGVKQNGVQLGDVVLPPWAKGDPLEFIRVHRESLESDYVSAHLHEWIDLIFGYKQQGAAAVDARNLFHYLFYEGNVNFEAIDDPLTRNATIGFINNFGQIPTQLFKKPHPMKKASVVDPHSYALGVTVERLFYHCLDSLKPPTQPVKELKQAVGKIVVNDKGVVFAAEQNKDLIPPTFLRYFAWGFSDSSLRLGIYDTDKSLCIYESQFWGEIICASCPNARTVVTGSTNTVVSVWEIVTPSSRSSGVRLELRKSLYGHTEPISC